MLATVRLPPRASVILVNASFKTQAVALAIVNINRVASKHIVNPWTYTQIHTPPGYKGEWVDGTAPHDVAFSGNPLIFSRR